MFALVSTWNYIFGMAYFWLQLHLKQICLKAIFLRNESNCIIYVNFYYKSQIARRNIFRNILNCFSSNSEMFETFGTLWSVQRTFGKARINFWELFGQHFFGTIWIVLKQFWNIWNILKCLQSFLKISKHFLKHLLKWYKILF